MVWFGDEPAQNTQAQGDQPGASLRVRLLWNTPGSAPRPPHAAQGGASLQQLAQGEASLQQPSAQGGASLQQLAQGEASLQQLAAAAA